ncbi:DNA-directed RNA polymerase, mitochondrial [Hypsibius exemplaris]|uniref:DNA-directed RNA polymerase n=1 Tax=Hypsibius exemplaris TaxID=2072580 RepID=A0A1W0X3B2_HYPEX|nr:DNA-directed RNA polymerase, mitochondrial [Hypsibius exemplaris]
MALRFGCLLDHVHGSRALRAPLRRLLEEKTLVRNLLKIPRSLRFKATLSAPPSSAETNLIVEIEKTAKKKNKPATKKQSSFDTKRQTFPPEVDNIHREIIKVLQNSRHQLKDKIRMLREREAAAAATAKKSRSRKTAPRINFNDHRLDILASHIHDGSHLHQDHLSNVSDFRIQAPSALESALPVKNSAPKKDAPPKKESKSVINKALKEEARIVEQCQEDATVREMTIQQLNSSLKSYILACAHIDLVKPIFGAIAFYREQYPSPVDRRKIVDVSVYNLLLNIFAKEGNMVTVKEIFQQMKSDGIRPNAQSFASALETIARHDPIDVKTAKRIIRQMQDENIPLQDMFLQCRFVLDERDCVLRVIHEIRPNFQPTIPFCDVSYQPTILESLNHRPSAVLKDTPYRGVLPNRDLSRQLLKDQMDREMRGVLTVKSIDAVAPDAKTRLYRSKLDSLKQQWAKTLEMSLQRNMDALKMQFRPKRGVHIYPYLATLPISDYVDILVDELIRLAQGSEGYTPSTFMLHAQLGRKVMDKYLLQCKKNYKLVDRLEKTYSEYLKYFEDKQVTSMYNCRQYWQKVEHDMKLPARADLGEHSWSKFILVRIGKFLYDTIINEIKMDSTMLRQVEMHQYVPAVYKVYRHYADRLKEEVKPHPVLVKLYKGSRPETLNFDTDMCPTCVPPHPWLTAKTGGYLLQKTVLTRLPEMSMKQGCVVDLVPSKQIFPILDTLNQLGASPWIVNKPVLDLIIQVFRNGGMEQVDIPLPVSQCPALPKITRDLSSEEKNVIYRQRFMLKKKRSEMFSLWCDALYKLSIANHFRDSVFWFPQNIDFRGRVYPVPPHFQHLGGDMARSMLLFAKGMPLGDKGLDWLKIHLINLTGLKKKSSLTDRLAWANEILDDILDSADNPLTGKQWWKESDDPWQTLACCMEIANASRSPNPAAYVSHFPVHQDGSCNGLQHYAALGRDQKGAEAVNLYPFETPQDVYSGVAGLVEKERHQDAAADVEIAKVLDGFVSRKVVKQTVMTIVYGVTRYGARAQIQKQLADIKAFPEHKSLPAASYLAEKTFDSIKQMFTSARQIQDWFVDCAKLISSVRNKPVEWVTPLGLPVVQPYFKLPKNYAESSRSVHLLQANSKPNVMKQKNAFPPNFVHSLDSSHMMLTCLHAARAGISFAAVHDSYWTHPANVDIMNKLTREQFVALHSLPILDDLSEFLEKRFSYSPGDIGTPFPEDPRLRLNAVLKSVPTKGKFDLTSVLRSTYFFS